MISERNVEWVKEFNENFTDISNIIHTYCDEKNLEKFKSLLFDTFEDEHIGILEGIMNNAWFRAPDNRAVYRIPGFSLMCSLLDGTIPNMYTDGLDEEET